MLLRVKSLSRPRLPFRMIWSTAILAALQMGGLKLMVPDELNGLDSAQQRELYDCVGQLKGLLRSGPVSVDLHAILPPPEAPHRRAVLHELIKIELETGHARQQGRLLEDFVRRYPELGTLEALP